MSNLNFEVYNMKDILNYLFSHQTLTKSEAKNVLLEIGEGKHNTSQIASFLTVFAMRSVTVQELQGFREAMLELCVKIDLSEFDAIDIVGTGGDGKDTFNISTTSAMVVAGAGYKVAKHGNYGVSSSVGSSNVLEHLGVKFTNNQDELKSSLDKAGFCMMHAQLFHPAMKHVGPIRAELKTRTFFNLLGPMINPAFVMKQFLGVYDMDILRLYGYLYQDSSANYSIVHSLDGYDEISLTGGVKVVSNKGEQLLEPKDFGLKACKQEALFGGADVDASAKILISILEGKGTEAQTNAVLANAGMAIQVANEHKISLQEGIAQARESIQSGRAREVLKKLTA